MKSGSDTVDLLMGWAMKAMNEKDFPLALDLLDQVVTMQPDFAEGWNKRATIEYMQDDYGKALADIAHALALEPRHFGAMSGMGMILREIEENEEALAVLRRALEIHPQLENIDTLVKELERKVGQDA
jgi:tetratricopeptide (TPR) repeat protein